MDLSIIIINYNTGQLIKECIDSVKRGNYDIQYEWLIVDNGSSDNSKEIITSYHPEIRWIQMGYNAGFARANNQGIRQSSSPVILLLNPDTIVSQNGLEECFKLFKESNYVACGIQLLNLDGTPQISGNFAMKGGLNNLLPLPFVGPVFKKMGYYFKVKVPNIPDSNELQEVDWINGAFLMVNKSAIDRAGLLDEDFFLYAEEAEWCSRLRKVGKLCIYGQVKVIHLQGSSSNKTFESITRGYQNLFDRKGLQIMVSNFVRIKKEFGNAWFLIMLTLYLLEIPVFILGTFISKLLGRCTYSYDMVSNYITNVLYLTRMAPTIISGKKHFYKVL